MRKTADGMELLTWWFKIL